jgi:hypothetical protein
VKYKDDGQVDSYFPLGDVPGKHILPTALNMFGGDNSLVSGTTFQKNPKQVSLGVFSAIFDRGGTFRVPVTLMKVATSADSSASPSPKDSDSPVSLVSSLLSVSSSDNKIYVLQDAHLDVVSLSGSVDHEYALLPPADKLSFGLKTGTPAAWPDPNRSCKISH